MSSIILKKKLFNTRLRNTPQDLQMIVSGATKDITDITKLLLSLSKYRADVLTQMSNAINKGKDLEGAPQAGILG